MDDATSSGLRAETERRLADAPSAGHNNVVVLGDSIVYGWGVRYDASYPALVEGMLRARQGDDWRLVNAGIPGETAVAGAERYGCHVAPFQPRAVVIAYGLNDGALARSAFDVQREFVWRARRCPALRLGFAARRRLVCLGLWPRWSRLLAGRTARRPAPRVSPALFEQALRALALRAQQDGSLVVLAGLMPLTDEAAPYTRPYLGAEQWDSYARCDAIIAGVAQECSAGLVRLAVIDDPLTPRTMFQPDRIHLTAEGQAWLARRVYQALEEALHLDQPR